MEDAALNDEIRQGGLGAGSTSIVTTAVRRGE